MIEECKSNSQGKRTKSERGREGMTWLSPGPVQATLRGPSPESDNRQLSTGGSGQYRETS